MSKKYHHERYSEDPSLAYRKNQVLYRYSLVKKLFYPRALDEKINQGKMTKEELEEVLSFYERCTVKHGMLYRVINGPCIAVFFGIITCLGFALLGFDKNFTQDHPWIVALILLVPSVIGVLVFICICKYKVKERERRYNQAYNNFKDISDELNKEYAFRKIYFDFYDEDTVLVIDFQTNDPIGKLREKSKLLQSSSLITVPTSKQTPSVLNESNPSFVSANFQIQPDGSNNHIDNREEYSKIDGGVVNIIRASPYVIEENKNSVKVKNLSNYYQGINLSRISEHNDESYDNYIHNSFKPQPDENPVVVRYEHFNISYVDDKFQ